MIAAFLPFLLFGPDQSGRWLNYCKKEKQGVADVTECNVVRTVESLNDESLFSFNCILALFFLFFFFLTPTPHMMASFSLFLIFLRYSRYLSFFFFFLCEQFPLKVFYHISKPLTFHWVMECTKELFERC